MSTQLKSTHDQREIRTGRDYYEYVNGNIYQIQITPGSSVRLASKAGPPKRAFATGGFVL